MHVLFEHKSYVESRIGLDLLRYRVRIWEQWLNAGNSGRLPVVIPVVVYHGAASIDRLSGDELRQAVTQTLNGGDELMLTIAEQWEQQATERGIQKGIEKGIEQGEARLLKQLLTWRFGSLPAWAEARLAGAEPARLEP